MASLRIHRTLYAIFVVSAELGFIYLVKIESNISEILNKLKEGDTLWQRKRKDGLYDLQ